MTQIEEVDNLEEGAIETQPKADNSQEETDNAPDFEFKEDNTENDETDPKEVKNSEISEKEKRHSEQMAGSRQEVEKLRNLLVESTFNDILEEKKDVSVLRDFYNKDDAGKKIAQEVAKKFDWGNTDWGTFENFLSNKTSQQSLSEEEIERLLDEREKKREHQKSKEKLEKSISKLPKEQQEAVKSYIDKFSIGLQLDAETADTLFESATLFVNKGKIKANSKLDAIKDMASGTPGNGNKPQSDDLVIDGMKRVNGKRIPL